MITRYINTNTLTMIDDCCETDNDDCIHFETILNSDGAIIQNRLIENCYYVVVL